jgi:hypothetical protein
MSYGARSVDLYRSAASYVDRVLRGAKVAELPIHEGATTSHLCIPGHLFGSLPGPT